MGCILHTLPLCHPNEGSLHLSPRCLQALSTCSPTGHSGRPGATPGFSQKAVSHGLQSSSFQRGYFRPSGPQPAKWFVFPVSVLRPSLQGHAHRQSYSFALLSLTLRPYCHQLLAQGLEEPQPCTGRLLL